MNRNGHEEKFAVVCRPRPRRSGVRGMCLAWLPHERRGAAFSPQGCWRAKDPSSVAVLPRRSAASVAGLLRSVEALARILRRVEALEFCGRVCALLTFLRDKSRAPSRSAEFSRLKPAFPPTPTTSGCTAVTDYFSQQTRISRLYSSECRAAAGRPMSRAS